MCRMNRSVLFVVFMLGGLMLMGQNTRNVAAPTPPKPQYQAVKKEKKGLLFFLKKKEKKQKTQAEEVAEFRARMKEVSKRKAKEEKLSKKKRYREHGYFGHKRPPKKRPPHKMKFCKVCQLKH